MSDHEGHRKRLREKFLKNGFVSFLDYEIIELLLTFGIPRKDCKPIAKKLIAQFGDVNAVINASDYDLKKTDGLGEVSIIGLKLAREILLYSPKSSKKDLLSVDEIAPLAMKEIGYSKKEIFKVYCLNTKGFVISESVSVGTINASIVHPRELFKIAIENSATSIIIAHNHPSGDITPSDEDIYTTRRLVEAGKILGIALDDHIIVSEKDYNSLKSAGFLK